MSSNTKINYLAKDELQYELALRNISVPPHTCVELLRKLLREHLNIAGDVKYLNGKIDLENEIKVISAKISIVTDLLENPDVISPLYVSRVNSKINHLFTRSQNLGHVKNLDEEKSQVVKNLFEKVQSLKSKFEELNKTVSKEELDNFETQLDSSQVEEEIIMQNLLNISGSSPVKSPVGMQETKEQLGLNTNFKLKSVESTSQYTSLTFNKLPNPLEKYLLQLPTTDGLDVGKLLQLLRCIVKLKHETQVTQSDLYQLLPSYCEGPLLNKVIEAKLKNVNIDSFHLDILTTFIPITLREKLKQDLVYRPQLHQEPLPVYISEIKINSEILKTFLPETDLVSFIKNGIRPEERNKLVFERNPRTFSDLDELCIQSNNINYNDFIRDSYFNNSSKLSSNLSSQYKSSPHAFQPSVKLKNDKSSIRTCFKCNKPGHLAKQCYSKTPKN